MSQKLFSLLPCGGLGVSRCLLFHKRDSAQHMCSLVNSLALSVQSLQKLIENVEMKHEPLSHCVFTDMENSTLQEAYGKVRNKFCGNVPTSSHPTLGFYMSSFLQESNMGTIFIAQ